jgi:hypothetical protein
MWSAAEGAVVSHEPQAALKQEKLAVLPQVSAVQVVLQTSAPPVSLPVFALLVSAPVFVLQASEEGSGVLQRQAAQQGAEAGQGVQ